MKRRSKYRKLTAFFMLVLFSIETFLPGSVYALTSGPAQPESKSFQAAGISDMVDLFTGNFNYNLPLMDVDGYPVNLSYQSGSNIDDEASWVGLGWNINVGAINRQLRGIPDDMNGDLVETEHYTKPKITVGGRLTGKVEVKGKGTDKLSASGSFTLGVFSDNYTGIGAELGVNAGISYNFAGSGFLTGGMNLGVLSNTSSGVDVTPSASLSFHQKINDNLTLSPGLTAAIGYNTRGGLKDLTLGATFGASGQRVEDESEKVRNGSTSYDLGGSFISYNTDPFQPKVEIPYRSTYGSFSFDIGGVAWVVFGGAGGSGYRSVREVKSRFLSNPSYGFLYAERGKSKPNALMDFTREKENMIIPELPNLAVPIATPDLFSYTSQAGSGQFRLYRGGTGVLFDNKAEDENQTQTLGFDAGFGAYAHGGVTYYQQTVKNTTQKWTANNDYLKVGDFQDLSANPQAEHVYFRQVGEKNVEDSRDPLGKFVFNNVPSLLRENEPIAVDIFKKQALDKFRFANNQPSEQIQANLIQEYKHSRRTMITYLTNAEAKKHGLDKTIKSYPFIQFNQATPFQPANCHQLSPSVYSYTDQVKKDHHIGEITVTDESGKRNVYGLPVYNYTQEEYSFAIGQPGTQGYIQSDEDISNNQVNVPLLSNGKIDHYKSKESTDQYFHKDIQPAYASSYLLTGILSPDYVDVTGNGITDDDLGTAIKFNYSKTSYPYQWRSPANQKATLNKALLADPDDDKASLVYGRKELWYLQSIETKTKIAYFITDDRLDGLGVSGALGPVDINQKQKVLKEIRLYSKADISRPIKVVKLDYTYELCKGVENFNGANPGKLTLKEVYFEYGNSRKGFAHPYTFNYNNADDPNFSYGHLLTDRWGSYKAKTANAVAGFPLKNDEFPYTIQSNGPEANSWAGLWQLSKINLPTGGEINVTYESDDYAYVQNRRAALMVKPSSLIDGDKNPTTDLSAARGVRLQISGAPSSNVTEWFKKNYLDGLEYLYTKFFVNVGGIDSKRDPNNEKYFDWVPCYAKVTNVSVYSPQEVNVLFETITDGNVPMNPIIHAAWQKMRMEYPRYAYPGYKNRIKDNNFGQALKAAVSAIFNAAKNLDELRRNFYKRASDENFADNIKLTKSFVRISKSDGIKLGGGSRVKRVTINDKWNMMSGNMNASAAAYGQEYEYRTKNENGDVISSGVASYEPSIGNDENPMRQPVPYIQRVKGALNNFYNFEEPFGESLFPGATVGYSKVTIRDLDENGNPDPAKKTGHVVNEFYTAKDFPVQLRSLSIKPQKYGPSGNYSIFGSVSYYELVMSQGYVIELNDMHGKPKAVRVFNQSGSEISSTEYHYNAEPLDAGTMRLKNIVKIIDQNGVLKENRLLGRDIEVFTDMREQNTVSDGETIMIGGDAFPLPFGLPGFLPHWPKKGNSDNKLFRSASTLKVIQYYGIIDKVIKIENGSSITTENVAYDGITGEVLVSKTQNEFDQPIYSVNIPAYWVYDKMGAAFRNEGTVIPLLQTNAAGTVIGPGGLPHPILTSFLQPGDELVDISILPLPGQRYWVIEPHVGGATDDSKKLIDRDGNLVINLSKPVKILRSGFRNILTPATSGYVCMQSPFYFDFTTFQQKLSFARGNNVVDLKVLTASTTLFDDQWGAAPDCQTCPPGYQLSSDGNYCEQAPVVNNSLCFTFCRGSFDEMYGVNGALIRQTPTSTQIPRATAFWGGACGPCQARAEQHMNPIPKRDSTKWKTASTIEQSANLEPNVSLYPNCQRTDIAPWHICGDPCGRLIASGIWLCGTVGAEDTYNPVGEWIGFETCINIPEAGDYFIGYASDNDMRIFIDDVLWKDMPNNNAPDNYRSWYVEPYPFQQRKYKLRVEFINTAGPGSAGVEIYDNLYSQIIGTDFGTSSNPAHLLFSTLRDIGGNTSVQAFRNININTNEKTAKYTCSVTGQTVDVCEGMSCARIPVNRVVNPYVKGFAGNWRAKETKVYQVNRKYADVLNPQKKGVELKNAGHLEKLIPFWFYDDATSQRKWKEKDPASAEWVSANTITLYDKYGQELENRDALGRYSAATFVFRGDLPGAVASNSRNREIYSEGFEDQVFRSGCLGTPANCNPPVFVDAGTGSTDLSAYITNVSHSGNNAISLPASGLRLRSIVHDKESKSESYLDKNAAGEYVTKTVTGLYPVGFQPKSNTKYIFSVWVKDNEPTSNSIPITVSVGAGNVTLVRKATVEKWKLVEGTIDIPPSASGPIEISLTGGAGVLVDDLRIHPFDGHMKTYAYDDKTLRLMAELDENNFATFYEYDDEGSLTRVKKETERGIMTIKETRSSYRKTRQVPID